MSTDTFTATAATYTVIESPGTAPALVKTVEGLTVLTVSSSGVTNHFLYDALNRQTATIDGCGNTNSVAYNAAASGSVTTYAHDNRGRETSRTDAFGNTVHSAYDSIDNIAAQWGATYPVAYRYDTANRKTAMYTYRGCEEIISQSEIENLKSEMDCTQWRFDPATGFCTNKVYADDSRGTFTFTSDGRPLRTAHPSGKWKENAYDPATGDLAGVTYSDGTPPVTYARDRIGRVSSVTDVSGWHLFTRNPDGSVASEDFLSLDVDDLFTFHEFHDGFGRPSGYVLTRSNTVTGVSSPITDAAYEYDPFGRLSVCSVGNIPAPFRYGRLPGSDLVQSLAMPNGVTRETVCEPHRDLPASVTCTNASGTVLTHRVYTRDALARVTSRTQQRSGDQVPREDAFEYGTYCGHGELELFSIGSDSGYYWNDTVGNRAMSDWPGCNTEYHINALNQPIYVWADVSMPFEHDADGNQTLVRTSAGIWHVQYNAENRPVCYSNETGRVIDMAYDYMGRMAERMESQNGIPVSHERYIYRGYLRIAALDMLNGDAIIHTVVWDPTEPTASRPLLLQTPSGWLTCGFDQAKNGTELFDSSGNIAATYDFGPFGETLSASGPAAVLNPFRFSSEVWDATLGLVYYNWRHYNPTDGRFTTRDPIEEDGGLNLYGFVGNDPVNRWDRLGLADCCSETQIIEAGALAARVASTYSSATEKVTPPGQTTSTEERFEYCGILCCGKNSKDEYYVYTEPEDIRQGKGYNSDSGQHCDISQFKCKANDTQVGWFHSHPNGGSFSNADLMNAGYGFLGRDKGTDNPKNYEVLMYKHSWKDEKTGKYCADIYVIDLHTKKQVLYRRQCGTE